MTLHLALHKTLHMGPVPGRQNPCSTRISPSDSSLEADQACSAGKLLAIDQIQVQRQHAKQKITVGIHSFSQR